MADAATLDPETTPLVTPATGNAYEIFWSLVEQDAQVRPEEKDQVAEPSAELPYGDVYAQWLW